MAGGILLAAGLLFGGMIAFSLGWLDGFRGKPAVSASVSRPAVPPAPGPAFSRDTVPVAPEKLSAPAPSSARVEPSGASSERLLYLEQENRKLVAEKQELQTRLSGVLNWILTNFKGKVPLPEPMMDRLQVPPVTGEYTLHPEAATLLNITPQEEQKINDIFSYARQYLAEIEAALLTATSPRPDKVILHLPPFQEDGRQLQEDMYAALEITLGPNRFDRFVRVTENGLRSSFYQFGEASRTMVFELVYAGGQEPPRLKIKDGWILDGPTGTRTITATESTVTNLPPEYLAYRPWLPAELGGAAR